MKMGNYHYLGVTAQNDDLCAIGSIHGSTKIDEKASLTPENINVLAHSSDKQLRHSLKGLQLETISYFRASFYTQ